MNRLLLGLAVLIALVVLAGNYCGVSWAQEQQAVGGTVENGTAGGSVPAGLIVLVLAADEEGRAVYSGQAATDEIGRFQVPGLPVVDGARYSFRVDYAGVSYGVVVAAAGLSEEVRLTVYGTTSDGSAIQVTNQVTVIAQVDKKEREIAAIEFVRLTNRGDRTVLPDLANPAQMGFLRFSLPPRVRDLNVNSDLPSGEIISVGTGFALTSNVIPGDHSVEYSYVFPYRGDAVSYRQSFHQGAEVYQVLVPGRFSQIEVDPLKQVSSLNIQGTAYQAWEKRGFQRGEEVVVNLGNLPQPSLPERLQKSVTNGILWQFALPGVLGAVLASLLLFGAFRGPVGSSAGAMENQPGHGSGNSRDGQNEEPIPEHHQGAVGGDSVPVAGNPTSEERHDE